MYLSQLLIDTGGNPDRPRPGRMWLNNIYHVHQRLSMAFGKKEDHNAIFLFRIDNNISSDGSRAMILVQSEEKPDWDQAFHNAPDFLAFPPECKPYEPVFQKGDILRYRLLANPTKKITVNRKNVDGVWIDCEPRKIRVSVGYDIQMPNELDERHKEWLERQAMHSGFVIKNFELQRLFRVVGYRPNGVSTKSGSWNLDKQRLTFNAALMEGVLEVTDPSQFMDTIRKGIGSAKSFGFGLLSVIRR